MDYKKKKSDELQSKLVHSKLTIKVSYGPNVKYIQSGLEE